MDEVEMGPDIRASQLAAQAREIDALREALENARTWFSQIADNSSDPTEPVADNGATVWDAVRDFALQRARDIDQALSNSPAPDHAHNWRCQPQETRHERAARDGRDADRAGRA